MTESMRIIEQMLSILEDDHMNCNLESDEECRLIVQRLPGYDGSR